MDPSNSETNNSQPIDIVDTNNTTYITLDANEDELVQLVEQSGGQIHEVHVTDDHGNVQQVTYTYEASDGQQFLQEAEISDNSEGAQATMSVPSTIGFDPSFEFYDNVRGKINNSLLSKLVKKYGIDEADISKQARLERWDCLTSDYCNTTGQTKNRTALMKRWSSSKYYKMHEGKPVEDGGKVKGCFVKTKDDRGGKEVLHRSLVLKQFKEYEALKLEAVKMEKAARKVELENAHLEQEYLKKENEILDLQLEAAKLEVELRRSQAKNVVFISDGMKH